MSKYKVDNYINKKFNDIAKDTPIMRAYTLGNAVGFFQVYKYIKKEAGIETARDCFRSLDGDEEYVKIIRTLIELDNKENVSYTEKLSEIMYEEKEKDILSDDDRDLIEDFADFTYQKRKMKEGD
jgi:hypothetical protein